MFSIQWSRKALKQILKIDRQDKETIFTMTEALVFWLNCQNVKRLAHRSDYRLRVGRYRIFFVVKEKVQIIGITEVRKRDERTY